jgi:hypothetical protein
MIRRSRLQNLGQTTVLGLSLPKKMMNSVN